MDVEPLNITSPPLNVKVGPPITYDIFNKFLIVKVSAKFNVRLESLLRLRLCIDFPLEVIEHTVDKDVIEMLADPVTSDIDGDNAKLLLNVSVPALVVPTVNKPV
jgi:hypothetical protein